MSRAESHPAIAAASAAVDSPGARAAVEEALPRTSLGVVTYALSIQQKASRQGHGGPDLADPLQFLDAVRRLGAAGMQVPLGVRSPAEAGRLRALAERHGMFVEGTSVLPKTETDLARFSDEMKTARECGASVVRTVIIPGRRYEQFKSFAEFKAAAEQGRQMLRRAEPIARRHRVRLAVENHKDQRTEERLNLLAEFDSEFIGACFDVGNNLALLEDPVQTAEAFADRILTVHFKDQGVAEYAGGFLLADVPVGAGCIDLPAVLNVLKTRAPTKARLSLELITRDALKVPAFEESYWTTLKDLPARDVAAMLKLLKTKPSPKAFPIISTLPLDEQVKAEQSNVAASLEFAINQLGLTAEI